MKICIIANALAVHTQRWAEVFAQRGHEVHLLSIRRCEIPGVKSHAVHIGPANTGSVFLIFLSYFFLLITAWYHIRKIKPDIVDAHFVLTHGVIAACANYHPLVITAWGSDVIWHRSREMPWYRKCFLSYALKRADLVCAASKFLIRQLIPFTPPGKRIQQNPFGVDCRLFRPSDNPDAVGEKREFRIGFIKTLYPIYGPDVLIKSLPVVIEKIPNARLIMIGRNRMGDKLYNLVESLSLTDKVTFTGFITNELLPEYISTFDVVVNPSICRESFGVTVLEASACEVPVVASKTGGLTEVCLDNQTGILVNPNEPEDLAHAIIHLAQNPSLRKTMGQVGRKMVLEKYNWEETVEEKLVLFKRLIHND